MNEENEDVKEMTPDEFIAYKKGKMYSQIASSISWIAFVLTMVGCATCNYLNNH